MADRLLFPTQESTGLLTITIVALVINIVIWFTVKGRGLWIPFASRFITWHYSSKLDSLINLQLIASLGMGYYTLQVLGYIIDCYWENVIPQKNPHTSAKDTKVWQARNKNLYMYLGQH